MVMRRSGEHTVNSGTDSVSSNRRRFLKTAGVGALTGIAGCLGSDSDEGSSGAELPDTLTIGHPSPARPVYNLPTYTTFLDRMEEQGVTIEPKTFSGFTGVVAGMVSDEVDLAYVTPPSLVNATNEGFPIKSIAELSQRFSQQVIAQPDIDDWEELRGETLVAHSPQSFSALVLRSTVEANLGDIDAVDYRYIIGTPNRLAAMESGDTLATTVFTSGAISAEQEGYAKLFANPNDSFDPMTLAQWTLLESQINENEEMYQAIVDEMVAAYEDVYDGDSAELANSAINSPTNFPDFGEEIWTQTIDQAKEDEMWPAAKSDMLGESKVNAGLERAVATDLIEEAPDVDDIVDRRFIE